MKVMQINCFYPGGSTGKIVADIHNWLKENGHESRIIYGLEYSSDPDAMKAAPEVIRKIQSLRARITGYAYGGCLIGTASILCKIKAFQPDVVHLHCVNAFMVNVYRLLDYLKKNDIPTVFTIHAEFPYTAGCSHAVECTKWLTGCRHCEKIGNERPASWFFDRSNREWKLMQRAYRGFDKLVLCTVSDWLRDRAIQSPFYHDKRVVTVLNGLNTNVFKFKDTQELRNRLELKPQTKIILHVTPSFSNRIKGGKHVLEMANRMTGEDVVFLVVGAKNLSIEVPSNVRLIAHTKDQDELATYYSMADVCLLTSLRETFSMVCAESLCCGTPVVGFKAGAPETISIPEYSEFVEQGDDDALEEALRRWLYQRHEASMISEEAKNKYACTIMAEKYYSIYDSLQITHTKR